MKYVNTANIATSFKNFLPESERWKIQGKILSVFFAEFIVKIK